jgi:hypothetical protein
MVYSPAMKTRASRRAAIISLMKKLFLYVWMSTLACSLRAADSPSVSAIRNAIQSLDNQSSYTWTSIPKSELPGASSQGPTEGKTEKGGFTYFKLKVGENTVEAAFKGAKSAIKGESTWESSDELKGDREWIARRLQTFNAPVAEAVELLSKATMLKPEKAGLYSGDLTPEGVKGLMSARSRTAGQADGPRNTKGWIKFWIKDGTLVRYEYNLQGKVMGQDLQEHDINRTTTVEIKDVGSTKVNVPDEAKKKL